MAKVENDFTYSNRNVQVDSFIYERIWQILHATEFPTDILAKPLRSSISNAREHWSQACSIKQIPYTRSSEGIRYFTYGGYLVNKAIGLIADKARFQANDVSLLVSSPIIWTDIPDDPRDYESVFHLLFEASAEQSIYQALLPLELQLHEFLQGWLKDETILKVLTRLANSTPVMVDMGVASGIS